MDGDTYNMLYFDESGPQLTERDISDFEKAFSLSVPHQYRLFLLTYNGGRPRPDTIAIGHALDGDHSTATSANGATNVDTLFGLRDPVESCNIDWNLVTYRERLRSVSICLLPIGCDSGGSIFCIVVSGHTTGHIVYCDLESVFCDYDAIPRLYAIATSFNAFLSSLRDAESLS